jgi:uncharacterized membrane protein
MSEPVCPPNYTCTFTPKPPEHHYIGPWWEGAWGTVATIVALVVVAFVLCWFAYYWYEAVKDKRERRAARERREYELALQEQFTAQVDMAKGDEAMLKIVQEQQRRVR